MAVTANTDNRGHISGFSICHSCNSRDKKRSNRKGVRYDGYILRHNSDDIYPLYANKFLHKYAFNSFDTSK